MSDEKRRDTREFGRVSSSATPADDKQGNASRARNRTVLLSPEHIGQIRSNMTQDGASPSSTAPAPDAVADLLPPVNWEYTESKGGNQNANQNGGYDSSQSVMQGGGAVEPPRARGQENTPPSRPRTSTESFERTEDGQFAPVSSRRPQEGTRGTGGAGSRPAFSVGGGGGGGRPARSNSGSFGVLGEEARSEHQRGGASPEPFIGSHHEEAPRTRAAAPLGESAGGSRESFPRESAFRESPPQEPRARRDTDSFEEFTHGDSQRSFRESNNREITSRGSEFGGERERDPFEHSATHERAHSSPPRNQEPRPLEREPRAPEPRAPEPRAPEPRYAEHAPEPRAAEPRFTESRSTEPRPVEPRPVEPRPVEPRSTESRPVEPRPIEAATTASGIKVVCKAARGKLLGFLVSFDVDTNGEVVELRSGRWLITSKHTDQGDYLLIDDPTVSPLHAIIRATPDGQVQVLDQLSEYGSTLIRGTTGEEEALAGALASVQNGDCVRFGNRQFAVCLLPRMKGR